MCHIYYEADDYYCGDMEVSSLKHNNYYNAGSEDIGLLVPEAQPRDTNNREVLFILITMGCKRFIMVQSVAEGPKIC